MLSPLCISPNVACTPKFSLQHHWGAVNLTGNTQHIFTSCFCSWNLLLFVGLGVLLGNCTSMPVPPRPWVVIPRFYSQPFFHVQSCHGTLNPAKETFSTIAINIIMQTLFYGMQNRNDFGTEFWTWFESIEECNPKEMRPTERVLCLCLVFLARIFTY